MTQPAKQQGVTLVELMVSITIGMFVSLIVAQAFMTGLSTQYAQTDLIRLQESGRFAVSLMQNELRKAGFRNTSAIPAIFLGRNFGPTSVGSNGLNMIDGIDNGPSDPANATFLGDGITLRFYGENDPAQPALDVADGRVLDCLGNAITRDTLVTETLFIAIDANNDNEPTLWCSVQNNNLSAGFVAPANCPGTNCAPLIPGIESFQILYGEDTDGDGVVNRYVPVGTVTTMSNVLSIKASLVVRSPVTGTPNPTAIATIFNHFGSQAYAVGNAAPSDDPGSVYSAPADGRFRLMFPAVVALRNYAF